MLTIANRMKIIVVHIKDKIRTIAVFGGVQGIIKVSYIAQEGCISVLGK